MNKRSLLIIALAWSSVAEAASPSSPQLDAPIREWQTRSFRFDDTLPILSESPALTAPEPGAGEQAWVQHIRQATEVFKKYFAKLHLPLPPGSAFAFDPATWTLAVRSHPEELDAIEAYAAATTSRLPAHLVFQLNLVQADAELLRKIAAKSMTQANMEPQWEQLRQLADKGQARVLQTARWEGRSGFRTSFETGPTYPFPRGFKLGAAGPTVWEWERRCAGLRIETEPTIGPGHWRVDVNLDFEYHYSAPATHMELVEQAGPLNHLEMPVTEKHCAKVVSTMSFGSGMTRLIAVWKPEGLPDLEKQDVLQAAFLRVDNTPLLPVANPDLAANLDKYADKVSPLPDGAKDRIIPIPPGMQRRVFKVPADFLASAQVSPDTPPPDPFAAQPTPLLTPADPTRSDSGQRLMVPKDSFNSMGVPFPDGADAFFDSRLCLLTVINTPKNLDAIEASIDSILWCIHPNGLIGTLQIIQADETTLRTMADATANSGDNSAMLHKLEELAAQGKAKFISTQRVETHTGQHAEISAGEELMKMTKFHKSDLTGETTGESAPVFIGTQLKMDLTIGPDGYTVDVSGVLEHHFRPVSPTTPDDKPDALGPTGTKTHGTKITLHTTLWIRTSRLLALWKPEGENSLQAAFLTLNYLPFDEADLEPPAEK